MENFKKEIKTHKDEYLLNVNYSYSKAHISVEISNKNDYLLDKYGFVMSHFNIIAYCVEAVSKYEDSLIPSDNDFMTWDGDMRKYLTK